MKHFYSLKIFLLLTLIVSSKAAFGATVVHGNDLAQPGGFTKTITAKVFERRNGAFTVGLGPVTQTFIESIETSIDTLMPPLVARAVRPNFRNFPQFNIILRTDTNATPVLDRTEFLALSPQTTGNSIIAGVFPTVGAANFSTNIVTAFETDGSHLLSTPALNDATGNASAGIMALAGSPCNIFAAVRPTGDLLPSFGEAGSGIAVVCIKRVCDHLKCLVTKDAPTGEDGNLATPLNNESFEITDGTVEFQLTATCGDVCTTPTTITLYFDQKFDRLYIGTSFATSDRSNSVAIGRIDCGALEINPIVNRAAISAGASPNEIVVVNTPNGALQVNHLAVMHASTGPSYLIVNGNRADGANTPCNRIFALPLVDDPCQPQIHGTLADKNSALVNNVFVTPASLPGQLANDSEPAAAIALINTAIDGQQLPIANNTGISDMVVVGDTVYVSIAHNPCEDETDVLNDTGIFYSQALFGPDGKIVSWTPWTKRGIPVNAFGTTELPCCACHTGPVCFFEVDALTGNIWFVEGNTRRVVGITNWTRGEKNCCDDLLGELNQVLKCGSYSVLDLDQATRLFTNLFGTGITTPFRYALFGGVDLVAIALTSIAKSNPPILSTPQDPIDCCTPQPHVIVTQIPNGGCISSLEYSRTFTNFFFAGSDKGLFAFADIDGNGFPVNNLRWLDLPPFTTNSWHKITTIPGAVLDIKTSGAVPVLYVLVTETLLEKCNPTRSTLYSIPFTDNINTMFNESNLNIIAQTGVGIFNDVRQFFGVQIISTGLASNITPPLPEDTQQLILATNHGLYKTDKVPQSPPPIDQEEANWELISDPQDPSGTQSYMFNGIAGIDTPIKHTVWPISLRAIDCCKKLEHGRVDQINGSSAEIAFTNPEIGTFLPEPFMYNATQATPSIVRAFNAFPPITYFWSDGARRFFIVRRTQDCPGINRIIVSPYDIAEWNVTTPILLSNPALSQETWFYWIKQIGATGILMAGTERGVVGLR